MFKKANDPLVNSVKAVMKENEIRRQAEAALNEELGITSKKALPHEYHEAYDRALEEMFGKKKTESPEETARKKMYDSKDFFKSPTTISGKKPKKDPYVEPVHRDPNRSTFEEEAGSVPKTAREKDLAAKKPPYDKITKADVLKARGVITQEELNKAVGGNPITKPDPKAPKAIEEAKATSAQKKEIAKVMHTWKKGEEHIGKSEKTVPKTEAGREQAVAIALSKAGLSKKQVKEDMAKFPDDNPFPKKVGVMPGGITNEPPSPKETSKFTGPDVKSTVKEGIDSIISEIRTSLQEQLAEAYLDSDPTVFENFVNSLTEEQIDILGLNEDWRDTASSVGSAISNAASKAKEVAKSTTDYVGITTPTRPQDTAAGDAPKLSDADVQNRLDRPVSTPTSEPNISQSPGPNIPVPGKQFNFQPKIPSSLEPKKPSGTGTPDIGGGLSDNQGPAADLGSYKPISTSLSATPPSTKPPTAPATTVKRDIGPAQTKSYSGQFGHLPSSPGASPGPASPGPAAPRPASSASPVGSTAPRSSVLPSAPSRPTAARPMGRTAPRSSYQEITRGPFGTNIGGAYISEDAKPQIKESLESFLRNRFMKG